jgi:hypothetical protein
MLEANINFVCVQPIYCIKDTIHSILMTYLLLDTINFARSEICLSEEHYGVLDKWKASKHEGDHVNTYFELLLLVKTKSKNDKVWISFIEGLHRHAAIFASLLCMRFDYFNNIIIPGSLQLDDFEKA